MRLLAKLQKAGNEIYYIDHLQPVNPIWLERLFKKNNLTWINRSKTKYLKAAKEETKDIAASKNLTLFYKFFSFLRFVGVATFLAKLALKFNFYLVYFIQLKNSSFLIHTSPNSKYFESNFKLSLSKCFFILYKPLDLR